MELSQKIALLRKQKGLTQEQLAERAGVTVRTIQRIESGESIPRAYTLQNLAKSLEVEFEEFMAVQNQDMITQTLTDQTSYDENKTFLKILYLSSFSFLFIPLIHFLVPIFVYKNSKIKDQNTLRRGRKIIIEQVYWVISLSLIMLLTVAYNFTVVRYLPGWSLIHYLWPLIIMYFLNTVFLIRGILKLKNKMSESNLSLPTAI